MGFLHILQMNRFILFSGAHFSLRAFLRDVYHISHFRAVDRIEFKGSLDWGCLIEELIVNIRPQTIGFVVSLLLLL